MSRVKKVLNTGLRFANDYLAYSKQVNIYRKNVAEAAKEYVDAHCDSDSLEECTDKYMALEKAVKKLRALESLK